MTPDRPSLDASPVLKSSAIFIAVWLHVLPRSTLIVSLLVKATKHLCSSIHKLLPQFFSSLFFCRQLKIIASFMQALTEQSYVFCTVWSYFSRSEENQRWLLKGCTVRLIMGFICYTTMVVVTAWVCVRVHMCYSRHGDKSSHCKPFL